MSMWIPNGQLKDGTLLFGPMNESPSDMGSVAEVVVGERKFYVAYCGDGERKPFSDSQKIELQEWVRSELSRQKK